jgi:type IV pilus assembly protein PilB
MAKFRLRGGVDEASDELDEAQLTNAATQRLGEHLVQHNLITPAQLAEAISYKGLRNASLGDVLAQKGFLPWNQTVVALAELYGVERADLRQGKPDEELLEGWSEEQARGLLALPWRKRDDGKIEVIVSDPSEEHKARVADAIRKPFVIALATPDAISTAIGRSYRADSDIHRFVQAFAATEDTKTVEVQSDVAGDDAPVVQVVNRIVAQALRDRTSDVHLEPMDDRLRVRYRIDGNLVDVFSLPNSIQNALVSRLKIMGGMNIVERRRPQDGQFSMTVDGKDVDVRVASVSTVFGEKVVLRLLDKSRSMLSVGQLGMPADTYEKFHELVHSPFGMVICAGPTGAGKTTTLYATLGEVNSVGKNVMTIEDPVEYVFPGINQIQTNDQAGLSFATGLKAILRQDPDVILVGEIRDADTARIAIQSALTGHFVLSSLHGTDSVAALHRFLDMGIESFLIASSVVAVVGQRLLRRICDSCKEPYQPDAGDMSFYIEHGGGPKDQFWHGAGCNFCAGTGYRDRIGVYELLRITPEIRRLIVGWATQEELKRLATNQGMRTLTDEAITLVESDITTIDEVIRTIYAA